MQVHDQLDELEATLHDGIQQSGQTSLGRRLPLRAALPILAQARAGLRAFVEAHPGDVRGWRLLSLAEETLLSYPRALKAIKRVLELTAEHDKRDLKRLAALRTTAKEWDALRLTAVQVAELGAFLDAKPELQPNFLSTHEWLDREGISGAAADRVIAALEARGARCDEDVAEIARGTWI